MKKSYKEMSKLEYLFYITIHPIDGYNEMKNNKKGSVFIANIVLIAWFFGEICRRQLTDFAFNQFRADQFNVFYVLLLTVVLFFVATIANWCFCTLLDGKGKFLDIWIAVSYALIPLVICLYLNVILSWYFISAEGVFLTYISVVSYIWTGALVFMALSVTHEYSFSKTIFSILLTILGMFIILFLALLAISLYNQLYIFLYDLINEIMLRF